MTNSFLKILVNGQNLDLLPGSELVVEEPNQAFEFENILGSFSYPFKLAFSGNNRVILGLSEIVENINPLPINLPCQIQLGGSLYKNGGLNITKCDGRSYEATFTSEVFLVYNIKDKKLVDFEYGGDRDMGVDYLARMDTMRNAATLGYPTYDFTFVMIFAENFKSTNARPVPGMPAGSTYINLFFVPSGEFNLGGDTDSAIIPFLFLTYVLRQIFIESGIAITISEKALALIEPAIIFNNYTVEVPNLPSTTSYMPERYMTPTNHLPDMTVSEFLGAIRKMFGLYIEFKKDEVLIYTINELIDSSEIIDITGLCAGPGVVEFLQRSGVNLEQNIYPVKENLLLDQQRTKIIPPSQLLISDIPGTVNMWHGIDYYDASLRSLFPTYSDSYKLMPHIDCPATEHLLDIYNECPFSVLFWRGMQEDEQGLGSGSGLDYPMGTSGFVDYYGNVIGEALDLYVDGSNGIYEVCLKKILELKYFENKKVSQTINASQIDAINITPLRRVSRLGVNFMVLSKKFVANNSGIKNCVLELLKI